MPRVCFVMVWDGVRGLGRRVCEWRDTLRGRGGVVG